MKTGQPTFVGILARLLEPLPYLPDAACVDRPDLTWTPEDEHGPAATAAISVCCHCPHVAACGAWGIDHPHTPGIWGGLTTEQRHTLAGSRCD